MICPECGQPVAVAPSNIIGEQAYHGPCYRMAFPPEHPEEWPKPITPSPDRDTEWVDHHGR